MDYISYCDMRYFVTKGLQLWRILIFPIAKPSNYFKLSKNEEVYLNGRASTNLKSTVV